MTVLCLLSSYAINNHSKSYQLVRKSFFINLKFSLVIIFTSAHTSIFWDQLVSLILKKNFRNFKYCTAFVVHVTKNYHLQNPNFLSLKEIVLHVGFVLCFVGFCFSFFYWSIVDLQCCVSFRCIANDSYIYIYILFQILFH